eukprot:1091222-Pyramimonas_sp.AAC.1
MAIPAAVFDLLEKRQGQVAQWWASARREVRVMRDMVPMMSCVLDLPAAPVLFASDAEGANRVDHGGCGIVVTAITQSESEQVIGA